MTGAEGPVFVRGLSRSGGTLVVTMLDAHPSISMSYELYPNMLIDAPAEDLHQVAAQLEDGNKVPADWPNRFRTFFVRTARGGLDLAEVAGLLRDHAEAGLGFDNNAGRVGFVERCGQLKRHKEGKARWGAKCDSRYADYTEALPTASFLNVVRDGRDVLASQLTTGSFNTSAEQLAASWTRTHEKFRRMVRNGRIRGHEIVYERLVADPAAVAAEVCAFLGEDFDDQMLTFHQLDLSIFDATHLSMDRISQPVDESKVGRWRRELSDADVAAFEAVAGPTMREFGYEPSS